MGEKTPVYETVRKNEEYIRKQCEDCADIIIRPMRLGDERKVECLVVYLEVAVSNMMLEDSVIGKLINHFWEIPPGKMKEFLKDNSLGISDVKELSTLEEAMGAMLAGNAIFFMDGYDRAIKIASKGYPSMGVGQAQTEKVLRGSKEGFTDSVKINSALIRKRLKDTRMKVVERQMGIRSNTMLQLLYVDDLVQEDLLDEIQKRLDEFEIDGIFDSGMVEQLTEEVWYSPFPQFQATERPDRAAMELLEGRVVLLCDNSPMALLLPTTFHSFMTSSEDMYNRFEMVSFIQMLRYLAVMTATLLPGLYLAVIRFHTQILPANLILSFAEARSGVPFSSIVELIFLELSFELIREAGVRMPGSLGSTIGIVGGLIVGQAAVTANLVSPIVVIIVALTALGSLAIPSEEFSAPFRLLKYMFLFAGGYFGLYGIVLGIYLVVSHLAGLLSFQVPYLTPFVKKDDSQGGGILRRPLRKMNSRPVFARKEQRIRLRRRMKG
ncbi:spore germination protein [Blautia hydrogenotrophica]|uniref:spore germination protein n=1 Tax=Blautia hydrogenotrophica TaxID=53443 RepID=UPI003AB2CBCE